MFKIPPCCSMHQHFMLYLLSNSIPLQGYATLYLSVHQLMVMSIVSTFWLLWIMLLWTFMFTYSIVIFFSLGYISRSSMLCHAASLCLTFDRTTRIQSDLQFQSYILFKYPSFSLNRLNCGSVTLESGGKYCQAFSVSV